MPKQPTVLLVLCAALMMAFVPGVLAQPAKEAAPAEASHKKPKFYFNIREVNVGNHDDPGLAKVARDAFQKELDSRPEFTSDIGGITDPAAVLAELKRRGLKGFRMSLRLDKLSKDLKEPKPGARLKQLEVGVQLSVFGTTLPGEKLAFSGEGEAVVESEVPEARAEQEGAALAKEVIPGALKQAVDQAVMKLSMPKSAPMNESKRKRKR
jgi:hypothetical protein